MFSRETFLLGNNILLMAAMLVVVLGTLLHKELGMGSISIGEPFFQQVVYLAYGADGAAARDWPAGSLAAR